MTNQEKNPHAVALAKRRIGIKERISFKKRTAALKNLERARIAIKYKTQYRY